MGSTANFGLPYPDATDNVNLWEHFEDLAVAIDTALEGLDDENDALAPVQYDSSDNNGSPLTVLTTTGNGSTVAGGSFVAPPSGKVMATCHAVFQRAAGTGQLYMGPQIRDGGTAGSGTIVFSPTVDPGAKFGTSGGDLHAGGCSRLITGLTPGATYNISAVYFAVSPSSLTFNYFSRQVAVYPQH